MSQRRSYPNSGDFNLDDLFRPEPATDGQGTGTPVQAASQSPYAQPQNPVPQQQSAPPLGQSGSPEYWGAPQQAAPVAPQGDVGATQYLPPYPAGDPSVAAASNAPTQIGFPQQGYAGGTFGGQQQYAAPAPAPAQPSYGGAYGAVPPQQQAYQAAPEAGFGGSANGGSANGGPANGGGRKPNTKVLIGAGVAGVAVIAVLIGVFASGGGDDTKKSQAKTKSSSSQSPSAQAGGGGADGAVGPETKAQAQAMSDLLGTASASRTSVVNAVSAVGKCQGLPDAQAALTAAAAQRQDLLKKLGDLKVDQLTDGGKLVEQLQKAWQASSTADSEYALWAGDMVAGCDGGKAKDNDHYRNGNTASGSATTAKEQASKLWGAIASKTGLAEKGATEL
ncbi:hypothetical protein ACFYST_25655 [Kitasatospora sp. NPDC004614]|uniref:hypothetical protein n=1 Tax=unclassified Kitasatospora TaxID=2633591 RepID=UPI0036C84186